MDCSLPSSFVHEILQARILEWVAILFSKESSDPEMESGSPASQADSLPPGLPGNPGGPPTNEGLSVQVLSSPRAYVSAVLPFAWEARCVCTQSTLRPAESSRKACYLFIYF